MVTYGYMDIYVQYSPIYTVKNFTFIPVFKLSGLSSIPRVGNPYE